MQMEFSLVKESMSWRFIMGDCKEMSTPMELKLKLPCDASVETLDTTMYRQMIGSLMYLTDTIPNI